MNRTISERCLELSSKTEENKLLALEHDRSWKREGAASELYLVTCKVQSFETLGDKTRPVASRRFGTREVTLIYLSFTNCRISIALAGDGVTLKGGKPKGTRGRGERFGKGDNRAAMATSLLEARRSTDQQRVKPRWFERVDPL
jgi:hypothetical protein